ncbi:hypothetical protein [Enterococcus sp. LJL51]|uniref:hypothetical protein n=1 Tax=Enterococcus sp. LJL51 TaxID=3416656 RepID=UPI003CEEA593
MFKMFNNETEWEIFQNVIQSNKPVFVKSKKEKLLLKKIKESEWNDNTSTRPDFIANDLMIEMFEIDDIVTTKKGKNNPQRKANARALRTVENWMSEFPEGTFHPNPVIIGNGDTRYNPETDSFTPDDSISHHNYGAYLNNFKRICQKHLDSVDAYKKNYPNKQLGFLIVDDSTYYVRKKETNRISTREAVFSLPFFDKNFMKLFIKSEVDFVLWAFNNKYFYTKEHPHGEESFLPEIVLLTKDNYYSKHSKRFDISSMMSLEE